ncbi:MAG: ABC transporter permease, partial [Candidatus Lokiarchaeota archaeon]|nr:ABC transporter permease [Candidatus Lokiarchaeota archaeon]
MLKFALKNAFRKKSVAVLSSLGIGFGLMLQFVLGGFSAGITQQVTENFAKALGVVQVTEYGIDTTSQSELPTSIVDDLYAANFSGDIEGHNVRVEMASKFTLPYAAGLPNTGDRLVIVGLNKSLDTAFGGPTSKMRSGTAFQPGADQAVIDSRLLTISPGFSTGIGDNFTVYINVVTKYNLTITGVCEQEDSGAPSFVPRAYYVYIDIITAWNLLGLEGDSNGTYTQLDIQFPAVSNEVTQRYVRDIEDLSADGYFGVFVEAFSPGEFQAGISDTLGLLSTFTSVISFITLIAGGMAIIVAQLNSVSARMKEFAILKSTGWTNGQIFKNIIYESLALGALGAAIGLALGSALILALAGGGGFFGPSTRVVVTPILVLQVVGFALGIGVIGGLYPGLRAARVRP